MFSFSAAAGWSEIEDFLRTPGIEDCEEERRLAGYYSHASLVVGDTEGDTFCVNVHVVSHSVELKKPYEFLVDMTVGGNCYYIAVPKLPDLLELLRQTVPLSTAIDEWAMKKDRYVKEIEKELDKQRRR